MKEVVERPPDGLLGVGLQLGWIYVSGGGILNIQSHPASRAGRILFQPRQQAGAATNKTYHGKKSSNHHRRSYL